MQLYGVKEYLSLGPLIISQTLYFISNAHCIPRKYPSPLQNQNLYNLNSKNVPLKALLLHKKVTNFDPNCECTMLKKVTTKPGPDFTA